MMMDTKQNIFSLYLDLLGVKHTKVYSNKYYEEHPHKNNLYGLSKMLFAYNIENIALRINEEDKESTLSFLEPPFIAYVGNNFSIVHNISEKTIGYIWNGKELTIPKEDFIQAWSGIILVAEPDESSIESDYKKHYHKELMTKGKTILLAITTLLLAGLLFYSSKLYENLSLSIALLINLVGGWISYLLLLRQMHVQSDYADKICSLFLHQSDCNSMLESNASKLFGLFSWSEIGLSYFTANILMVFFLPTYYPYVALINICALPYTVWSIWYQKVVAKQWCVLCLMVQGVLWLLFITNVTFELISWPTFAWTSVLLTGCIYIIPLLLLNILISNLTDSTKTEQIIQEINSLKADEDIFKLLLKTKPKHDLDNLASPLIWKNAEAKNKITIVTNPHCNPCAKMHERMEQLLQQTKNEYCVQYILTSFNEELEESSKLFIAMYQQKNETEFHSFLNDWYANGKNNRQEFYRKYSFDREDEKVLIEFQKQKEWTDRTKIRATPTVLFNGYELPERYKVEDLEYFTQTDM